MANLADALAIVKKLRDEYEYAAAESSANRYANGAYVALTRAIDALCATNVATTDPHWMERFPKGHYVARIKDYCWFRCMTCDGEASDPFGMMHREANVATDAGEERCPNCGGQKRVRIDNGIDCRWWHNG